MSMASFLALAETTESNAINANPGETYTITLMADPPEGSGTVYGEGEYEYGTEITISATANPGWIFTYWSYDGVIVSNQSEYSIIVMEDRTYTAHFIGNNCNVTVLAIPAEGGEVLGGGSYECGTIVTIEAIANQGYTFVAWFFNGVHHYSNTSIVTFTITHDITLHACFSGENNNLYEITVLANPEEGGEVIGGGLYPYGTQVTIEVTTNTDDPYENPYYQFSNWTKDGEEVSKSYEYTFTVTEDAVYVANFERWHYKIVALPNPPDACNVQGSGDYLLGWPAFVWAIISCDDGEHPYEFVNWLEDGIEVATYNYLMFEVKGDRTLIANYAIYKITTAPTPPEGGMVYGSGNYPPGVEVTLTATPNPGYEFVGWSKNRNVVSVENPYTFITALNDEELVANFRQTSLGIDVLENSINIHPNPTTGELTIDNGQLTIENIEIFDIYGRKLSSLTSHPAPRTSLNISHLPAGMYFVKISTDEGMVVKKVIKQ
jgi:hypothetical protein